MTTDEVIGAWFVWWRDRTMAGLGAYSALHRTVDHVTTLCKEPIRVTGGADTWHVGIRIPKREPRVHALKTCPACARKIKAAMAKKAKARGG